MDAATGRILYMNLRDTWLRGSRKGPLGKRRSVDEARERAWELIQALYPDKADLLQPDGQGGPVAASGDRNTYTFIWNEHRNGIPVRPSTVKVSLNQYTLDCVYLQYDLRANLVFPEAETIMTAEEALAAFRRAARATPAYERTVPRDSSLPVHEPEVKLRYRFDVPRLLNAITGEFLNERGMVVTPEKPKAIPAGAAPLKPASLPVTGESAEAFSREVLELPADAAKWHFWAEGVSADSPSLQLHWTTPGREAIVVLDRETGRVLEAHRTLNGSIEGVPELTHEVREAAEQEAVRVVQRLYGDLVSHLMLYPADLSLSESGRITFHFQRYVNGIPFSSEGVQVTVDCRTGEWSDIGFNWTDEVDVPAPEGIISPQQAVDALFRDLVPKLRYDLIDGNDVYSVFSSEPVELVLVYDLFPPVGDQPVGYVFLIDPYTGEFPAASQKKRKVGSSPIEGHWAEGELRFLFERRLIDEDGLNPDRPASRAEVLKMLVGVRRVFKDFWPVREVEVPDTDAPNESKLGSLILQALHMGILRPEGFATVFGGEEQLSRAEFALWLARAMGFGRLAASRLKAEPSFVDAAQLTAEERNAAALLEALGIIPAGGAFRGAEPVTVAEAAAAVVRMVEYLSETR